MKKLINNVKFKMIFTDEYPENIVNNTLSFLNIALKYNVKTIGIGYWMNSFKSSKGYMTAFYKNRLSPYNNTVKVENNCFCEGYTKENFHSGWPKIWRICEEFNALNKNSFNSGAGNSGQQQFDTSKFINGIWKYSDKNWHLLNAD